MMLCCSSHIVALCLCAPTKKKWHFGPKHYFPHFPWHRCSFSCVQIAVVPSDLWPQQWCVIIVQNVQSFQSQNCFTLVSVSDTVLNTKWVTFIDYCRQVLLFLYFILYCVRISIHFDSLHSYAYAHRLCMWQPPFLTSCCWSSWSGESRCPEPSMASSSTSTPTFPDSPTLR